MFRLFPITLCAAFLCVASANAVQRAPELAVRGKKATALLFIARDCPIANSYAPEIGRLHRAFAARGVAFRLIYEDTKTMAQAQKHAREYSLPGLVSVDADAKLARRVGATVMPEAVVLLADGRLVYRGRISDLYADFTKRRRQAARHDLRDALSKAVSARPSTQLVQTKAVGCYIVMP